MALYGVLCCVSICWLLNWRFCGLCAVFYCLHKNQRNRLSREILVFLSLVSYMMVVSNRYRILAKGSYKNITK